MRRFVAPGRGLGALVDWESAEQRLYTRAQVVETRPTRKIDAIHMEHAGHEVEVARRKLREKVEQQLCVDLSPLIQQRERGVSLRAALAGGGTRQVIEVLGLDPHPARHLTLEILVPRRDAACGELIAPGLFGVAEVSLSFTLILPGRSACRGGVALLDRGFNVVYVVQCLIL